MNETICVCSHQSILEQQMSIFCAGLFQNKTAIVTGGGTGIGKQIAKEFLALGANVIIASRKLAALEATAAELQSYLPQPSHNRCATFQCNIRDEQEVSNLFQFAVEKFGKVDFLINNGGGQFPSPSEMISANGWRSVIDLNLNGTFLCSKQAYLSSMREYGGSIVNIVCEHTSGFPGMSHTGWFSVGISFTRLT
jgi:peroxisomal trans-2-enoyl-CoA reductase